MEGIELLGYLLVAAGLLAIVSKVAETFGKDRRR